MSEVSAQKPVRRQRREFEPPAKRRFISAASPKPYQVPADTTAPAMGQRKREKQRGPALHPTPLKA
ncbi:hypothetical protein NKH75_07125 [Mesorhizobium sp. M0984]|uniref:hypothetical protein n=1 Tax=Mesorhizobium sp. M0984 TaxID=2957041 RepID=UPI00333B406B